MDDLLSVRAGDLAPYDVVPYEYGEFPHTFASNSISGADFDPDSRRLFVSFAKADRPGRYSNAPVIAIYQF
jgi:hypothetical protein